MDFTKALMLVALVLVLTDYVKQLIPGLDKRLTVLVAIAIGIISVFLVGATVWAKDQVFGSHTLEDLNTASKIVVGLFLAGGAAVGDKVLNAVRNIGAGEASRPPTQ